MSNELKDEYLYVNFEGGVWEIRIGNGKDEKKGKELERESREKGKRTQRDSLFSLLDTRLFCFTLSLCDPIPRFSFQFNSFQSTNLFLSLPPLSFCLHLPTPRTQSDSSFDQSYIKIVYPFIKVKLTQYKPSQGCHKLDFLFVNHLHIQHAIVKVCSFLEHLQK